jgi:DNA-binding transcriptional LysR family regulator
VPSSDSGPDLTPAELRVIAAAAQEGSFSAAAAKLGLTQSAVSHSVRATERKLGAVLFDRDRNGARPTAAGQRWFAAQDWLPPATINVADDSVLLSMVAHGMGMAIVPRTTAAGIPPTVTTQDLGAQAPTRTIGYVTTMELARSIAVRELHAISVLQPDETR